MSDKKQIKERILATEKTYQITQAMNMISTSKLKKCEKNLKNFRPISNEVKEIMYSLINSDFSKEHKAFKKNKAKPCYILIASDRGLIGNYNNQVFKYFDEFISKKHKSNDDFYVASIGFKAFMHAKKKKYNLLNTESVNVRDDILFTDFREISERILNGYIEGVIGRTVVFYTSFVNTMSNKLRRKVLLPISINQDEETKGIDVEYIYEPDKDIVLNNIISLYVNYTIYRVMLEAKTSEHASRMNAMSNAKDNCLEIERELTLEYNHARQNQITTELIDVINGSNAVN